jgi:thioredoxin-related protein
MTNGSRQIGLVLLILTCAIGLPRAQQPYPPLEYADDLAALGKLSSARGTPIMLLFTRPGCPFCNRARKDHLEPLRARNR